MLNNIGITIFTTHQMQVPRQYIGFSGFLQQYSDNHNKSKFRETIKTYRSYVY